MPTKAEAPSRRRATAAPKSSRPPKPPRTTPGAPSSTDAGMPAPKPDEAGRNEMIAVAAYFRAERRGFAPGDPLQDWVMAT